MNIEGATIPQDVEIRDAALSNSIIADLETTRVVFFAGDAIDSADKYSQPSLKGFGGIFLPHCKTLHQNGAKGMLYRCKLTAMNTKEIGEWSVMLAPGVRDSWEKGFVRSERQADGTWANREINGFKGSDPIASKEGELKAKNSNHIVFNKCYPGNDVRQATRRSEPHGAGGVVEVTALKGASHDEIRAAQLYFFPNWTEIQKGEALLPNSMRELEDHLKDRIRQIQVGVPSQLVGKYNQIGAEMLRSCTEFRRTGMEILKKDETLMKKANADGGIANYSPFSEMLLTMLEQKRKDDIVSGESSSVDRLARAIEKRDSGGDDLKLRELAIRERELAIKEKELGLTTDTVSAEPTLTDTDGDGIPDYRDDNPAVATRLCGQLKANGDPCTRELKETETACFQHLTPSE